MINRSAPSDSIPVGNCGGRRLRFAPALVVAMLALASCGSKPDNPELDARLAEMEKKVEAADKRSRQAISMAAQPNSASVPDAGGEPTFADDGGQDFDDPIDSDGGPGQDGVPQQPMIGPDS